MQIHIVFMNYYIIMGFLQGNEKKVLTKKENYVILIVQQRYNKE